MVTLPSQKTKIVATIGPASQTPAVLEQMIQAGLNVARLNFSHGDFSNHLESIQNITAAAKAAGQRVALMADLCGPKIRIGAFETESITLQSGDRFTLTTDDITGNQERVSVSFARLPQVVKPSDAIYLNDGYVQLEVVQILGSNVDCEVRAGGELRARKGLNLPGIDLGISAFTEEDHAALRFALEHGVDAVSQSFVEAASDIHAVREAARALGHQPFIIAKIERSGALERLDEILEAADGIMIARGDLGVEVPIERIAVIQKDIMQRANRRARPVITATQMLESMTYNRLPTRAEATDVSNAILDGTDAVMLSGESAVGRYPVEAVAMLAKIARAVEPTRRRLPVREMYDWSKLHSTLRPEHLIAMGIEASFEHASPAAVFAPTVGGTSARRISSLRLPVWTVAVSPHKKTCQDLQFAYGVTPIHEDSLPYEWTDYVKHWARGAGLAGQLVVLAAGPSPQHPEANHRMELIAT